MRFVVLVGMEDNPLRPMSRIGTAPALTHRCQNDKDVIKMCVVGVGRALFVLEEGTHE